MSSDFINQRIRYQIRLVSLVTGLEVDRACLSNNPEVDGKCMLSVDVDGRLLPVDGWVIDCTGIDGWVVDVNSWAWELSWLNITCKGVLVTDVWKPARHKYHLSMYSKNNFPITCASTARPAVRGNVLVHFHSSTLQVNVSITQIV